MKQVYKKIPISVSIHVRYLYQDMGVTVSELTRRYPQYSRTSLLRHARKKIDDVKSDGRHKNKGRPEKVSIRDERHIIRSIKSLTEVVGTFTSVDVQRQAALNKISNRTVRRCMNKNKFYYLQCRRKGLLTKEDTVERVKFAKRCKKLPPNFWTEGISFYLDGTSWVHKNNPCKQARTHRTRMWRKKGDGLKREYTAKGKKEGTGGRVAKYFVAIAHGKGVVKCIRYDDQLNGEMFANFIETYFPEMFEKGNNTTGKLFLQDGDPSQNSKAAKDAMDCLPCRLFKIPPRSPDLNPIENFFHLVGKDLKKDAIDSSIETESFNAFCERIEKTLYSFPHEVIDRTIESMSKRIDMVIANGGHRTKY